MCASFIPHTTGRGVDALKNDGNIVGAGGAGGDWDSIFENDQSDKVRDPETSLLLWKYATEVSRGDMCMCERSFMKTVLIFLCSTNIAKPSYVFTLSS
jgi:hypothetical protein